MKNKGFVPEVPRPTKIGGPDPIRKSPRLVIKGPIGKAAEVFCRPEEVTFQCPHCHGAIVLKIGKGGLGLFGL